MSDDEVELDDDILQAAAGGGIVMANSPTNVPGHSYPPVTSNGTYYY